MSHIDEDRRMYQDYLRRLEIAFNSEVDRLPIPATSYFHGSKWYVAAIRTHDDWQVSHYRREITKAKRGNAQIPVPVARDYFTRRGYLEAMAEYEQTNYLDSLLGDNS